MCFNAGAPCIDDPCRHLHKTRPSKPGHAGEHTHGFSPHTRFRSACITTLLDQCSRITSVPRTPIGQCWWNLPCWPSWSEIHGFRPEFGQIRAITTGASRAVDNSQVVSCPWEAARDGMAPSLARWRPRAATRRGLARGNALRLAPARLHIVGRN